MAFTDDDYSVEGVRHFRNVPVDWVDDLGRIAILSGAIEFSAYRIAHSLDLQRPSTGRTRPFVRECEDIVRRLDDPWLPNAVRALGSWGHEVKTWATGAPRIVDEYRNSILHRMYVRSSRQEGGMTTSWFSDNRDLRSTEPLTEDSLRTAITFLTPFADEGIRLWSAYPRLND